MDSHEMADIASANVVAGTGKCTKCGCLGFRSDSGDPERCINIKVPTKDLCGHLKDEHN